MVGADAKIDGLSVEDAINVIKQKHFTDLTPNDYAFLRAREAYLSDTDKAIYLEGQDPAEVLANAPGRALTREERIINENRPLQDRQAEISDAKNAAALAEKAIYADLTPEQRTEKQEALREARAAKAKELRESADLIEKAQAEEDEETAANADKSEERVALEKEATDLGVTFNKRTSDDKLREKIEEARA